MRIQIVLVIFSAILAASCSKPTIKGSTKILVPWPTDHGTYELQAVQVNTLKDSTTISGDAAKIFMEPKLSDDGLHGDMPLARFIETNEGVLIPTDFITSQLAGLYAHTEKLWELDRATGVDKLIAYPRKFGIKAKVYNDIGAKLVKNNATYVAQGDSTLIMPYEGNPEAPDRQLPIPLNAGVLAHEHFHAIFDTIMGSIIRMPDEYEDLADKYLTCESFDNYSEEPESDMVSIGKGEKIPKTLLHNLLVMRGINEGLADIWGWVYTGDDNFIIHSLPELVKTRTLQTKANSEGFISTEEFLARSSQLEKKHRASISYQLGTQIARIVRRLGPKLLPSDDIKSQGAVLSYQDRIEVAKIILAVLPKLKKIFEANLNAKTPIETKVLNDVLFSRENLKKYETEDCFEIQKVLSVDEYQQFVGKNCKI